MEHTKLNTYFLGATAVLLLLILAFNVNISSNVSSIQEKLASGSTAQAAQPANNQQPTQPAKVDVKVGDAPTIGKADAKVTIVEFSDPSCPFCAAAAGGNEMVSYMKSRSPGWEPAVPNIIKDYVNSGKVRIAFKFFPGHGKGQEAMKLLWCANEQEKFWQLHDVMFNNQKLMEAGDNAGLKTVALGVGLDSAKLDACLSSGKYDARFDKETQEGAQAGVQGTPAFFVNGQLVEGAVPYSTMKAAIESALSA